MCNHTRAPIYRFLPVTLPPQVLQVQTPLRGPLPCTIFICTSKFILKLCGSKLFLLSLDFFIIAFLFVFLSLGLPKGMLLLFLFKKFHFLDRKISLIFLCRQRRFNFVQKINRPFASPNNFLAHPFYFSKNNIRYFHLSIHKNKLM